MRRCFFEHLFDEVGKAFLGIAAKHEQRQSTRQEQMYKTGTKTIYKTRSKTTQHSPNRVLLSVPHLEQVAN